MPHPNLLGKRLSTFELPIFPFLAPRVFQPWPVRGRRTFSTPKTNHQNTVSHNLTEDTTLGGHGRERSTLRVWESANPLPVPEQVEGQQNVWPAEQDLEEQVEGRIDQFIETAGVAVEDPTRNTEDAAKPFRIEKFRDTLKAVRRKPGVGRAHNVLLYSQNRDGGKRFSKRLLRDLAKRIRSEEPSKGLAKRGRSSWLRRASARQTLRKQGLLEQQKVSQYVVILRPRVGNFFQRRAPLRSSTRCFAFHYERFIRRLDITAMHWNRRAVLRPGQPFGITFNTKKFPKVFVDQFINHETSASLREAWKDLSEKRQAQLWPELVITTLRYNPAAAMKVLIGTYTEPYPHGKAISECLRYIIWFYLGYESPAKSRLALELFDSITWLLQNGPEDHVYISQSSIFLLLDHLPNAESVEKLFKSLVDANNPIRQYTLMQFADRLAKAGGKFRDSAFDIMEIIGGLDNVDFNKPHMMSLCTTLLMASGQDLRPRPSSPVKSYHIAKYNHHRVFEYMLNRGMNPNIITYNVLIYKSLKAKETGGWEIYNLMRENGIEPDSYTYSILLNDAKIRMDDKAIHHLTRAARERSLLSGHILGDVLHAMLLSHERDYNLEEYRAKREQRQPSHGNATVFEKMLPVYCEYFKFEPLAHLVPELEELYKYICKSESGPVQGNHLLAPEPPIFVIMLSGLLKSFTDPDTPKIFYDHFKNLVQTNDPLLANIAKTSELHFRHLYNMILFAFGQHASAIPECLKVIADMSAKAPDPVDGEVAPLRPAKPDVSTWSVMVTIFGIHRQTRAAEKVIEMMRQRGMEPTNFTWTSLLGSYTRMQDMRMSMNVLERLQAAGYKIDDHMWWKLRKLRDRRALIEGMQKLEAERKHIEMTQIEWLREELLRGAEAEAQAPLISKSAQDRDVDEFIVRDMATEDSYEVLQTKGSGWREEAETLHNRDEAQKASALSEMAEAPA